MSNPSQVRVMGPLATHAEGFRLELARQSYTPHSASNQLQLMAHASRWLAGHGLGVAELTPARVEAFLADRRAEGYTLWLSSTAMVPVLTSCAASTWSRRRVQWVRPRQSSISWRITGST